MNPTKRLVAMRLATPSIILACLAALYGGTPHTGQQAPPIKLGTSGSNVKDINSQFCCTGTLGSQVKDANANKYTLSNNHVLARSNAGAPGEGIMQRGTCFGGADDRFMSSASAPEGGSHERRWSAPRDPHLMIRCSSV